MENKKKFEMTQITLRIKKTLIESLSKIRLLPSNRFATRQDLIRKSIEEFVERNLDDSNKKSQ